MAKKRKAKACAYTSIGGQALMEGILMRGPRRDCIALRLPDGSIELKGEDKKPEAARWYKKVPLLRGVIAFIGSMMVGYRALMYSAEKTGGLDAEPETKFEKWLEAHFGEKLMSIIGVVALVLGLAISLVLFKFLPMALVTLLEWLGLSLGGWRTVLEGVVKLAIFLGYLAVVSLMKEIRVTFMYHGAEHKTISCYEAGEPLTPENAAKFPRAHPRCGTSFLFLTIFIGILVGFLLPWDNMWLRLGLSLLTLPVVMGLGYEAIRLCGKYNNAVTRAIAAPGKWVQKLTTKEPTLRQLEVAIAALRDVLPGDGSDLLGNPSEETARQLQDAARQPVEAQQTPAAAAGEPDAAEGPTAAEEPVAVEGPAAAEEPVIAEGPAATAAPALAAVPQAAPAQPSGGAAAGTPASAPAEAGPGAP